MRYKLRIRTVLLLVNLVILALPLFGIQALRLYENELIRQTEASLISQGVYIREHFKAELMQVLGEKHVPVTDYGHPAAAEFQSKEPLPPDAYDPIQPTLDIAHERIRERADEARSTDLKGDPLAIRAGERISTLLFRAQRFSLAGVRIVDYQGIVVATSRTELGQSLKHREEVVRALDGEVISLVRERASEGTEPPLSGISRGGAIRIFLALPVVVQNRVLGAVVLSRTPIDIQKALFLNRYALMRYGGGLLLIVLLVSIFMATTISRPVEALIAQTKAVKNDPTRATEPIPHPGSKEIDQLSHAVADMAKTLSDRAIYIQTFAQNVSHEFKTPLAAVHAIVELMRDHFDTMSADEKQRFLKLLSNDTTRMQKLVERLLLLAKADVAQPALASCDVTPATLRAINRYKDQGMNVAFVGDPKVELRLNMADETFESLVANLLENAKQHAGPKVRVEVRAYRDDEGRVIVEVKDDGPGISDANQAKVFDPFFTTARESGGTGLGLSIVRALAEAHDGVVELTSAAGKGVRIRLIFTQSSSYLL